MEQVMTERCTCADMPSAPDAFILSSYWAFDRQRSRRCPGWARAARAPRIRSRWEDVRCHPSLRHGLLRRPRRCLPGRVDVVHPPLPDHGPIPNVAAVGFDTVVSTTSRRRPPRCSTSRGTVHGALFFESSTARRAQARDRLHRTAAAHGQHALRHSVQPAVGARTGSTAATRKQRQPRHRGLQRDHDDQRGPSGRSWCG